MRNHNLCVDLKGGSEECPQSLFLAKIRKNNVTPVNYDMSHVVRKRAFCICEKKGADQLRGNHVADQPLCFRYTDSTIPQLTKY